MAYKFGYSGKTDDISFSSLVFKTDYNLWDQTAAHLSIPYSFQSGPLGKLSGPGDLLFLLNQNIMNAKKISPDIKLGAKLAGGLNPSNVAEAVKSVMPFGLDICSGVRENGKLSERLLKEFFGEVQKLRNSTPGFPIS